MDAKQVPLRELLASVPANARLVIDDADGKGTRYIPVGRYCQESAAALAQERAEPVREPVALIHTWRKNGRPHAELLDWGVGVAALPDGKHTLYTAPPQREPLTREEIMDLCASQWAAHPVEVARLIERAHGIGGQDSGIPSS